MRLNYDERKEDLILDIVPEVQEGRQQEKKSIIYKLYKEGNWM